MSHTVATLTISRDAYDEIADKLRAAGYHHVFMGNTIVDMSGIALERGPGVQSDPVPNAGEAAMNNACGTLPEGYDMRICLENGAGWIEISDPEGNELDLETDTETLTERIHESVAIAIEHAAEKAR